MWSMRLIVGTWCVGVWVGGCAGVSVRKLGRSGVFCAQLDHFSIGQNLNIFVDTNIAKTDFDNTFWILQIFLRSFAPFILESEPIDTSFTHEVFHSV